MDVRHDELLTPGRPPVEPPRGVPVAVLALVVGLVLIHLALGLLSDARGEEVERALAFIPARYDVATAALPGGLAARLASPLSYMLVHADWTHLGLNAIWLLVFGTMVARRTGNLRFVALSVVTGLAGVLLFWLLHRGEEVTVIGASGAVSGLMAAAVRLIHAAARERAGPAFMLAPLGPLPSLWETLCDRQAQVIMGVWLALNVLVAFAANFVANEIGIAWEVHLGGFLLGLIAFPAFDRSGAAG